ncbi:DsbA family protein [Actinotalea sp. C106]|uniref:DsbA family oxidoreductase n=1 Tax=Actinotalea sp. C106 TaxID=2908644 RepID=UPI0020277ABE|nr:DsbA family oxidoreductase [Actinotalea sp. C106]
MPSALTVDVWSDIACPWCFIGKRKLEEALRRYALTDDALDVDLTFHSFELAPDTPVDFEGSEIDFLAHHKGVPADQVQQMLTQVTEIAAGVGLRYDFAALHHTNTRKAHQLTHLAKARGVQRELVEKLFSAYFEQGRHLGHDEELADLAAGAGLDRTEALEALRAGTYEADVDADVAQARAYGITGVPFFVIDGRYGVSGAQDPAVLEQGLQQAAADRAGVSGSASAPA